MVDFKLRQPESDGIYYFRIIRKYRDLGHFIDDIFVVIEISYYQYNFTIHSIEENLLLPIKKQF